MEQAEIKSKRAEFECVDYTPLPGHYKCQHYAGKGACALDNYMMCVEWLKKNPDHALTTPAKPESPEPAPRRERSDRKHLQVLDEERVDPGLKETGVYELRAHGATVKAASEPESRPLIEQPELLTEQQVDDFAKLGMEIELDTEHSGKVFLVPAYTGKDRTEFTFRDCRTLVTILQVFPGAKLEKIISPKREEAS